ncbi:MAG: hypothetical protein EAZ58_14585, partial [Flavobacterium sp.]
KEVLDLMRLNESQQYNYNRYLDYLHFKASEALTLKMEAEDKVRQNEKLEIAKKAIEKGLDNEMIADLTGLTLEQIEQLRNKIK